MTDPDGDALQPVWLQTAGPLVGLSEPYAATQEFIPPQAGTYRFELRQSDGIHLGAPQSHGFIISENQLPVARAGDDKWSIPGVPVMLDGSMSVDPEGKLLSYSWRQKSGPVAASVTGRDFPNPSIASDTPGQYVFELTVNDGYQDSVPDDVRVDIGTFDPTVPVDPAEGLGLSVSPNTLFFFVASDRRPPAAQEVSLASLELESVSWSAFSDQPWLSANEGNGTAPVGETASLQVQVDPAGMALDQTSFRGSLELETTQGPNRVIHVVVEVEPLEPAGVCQPFPQPYRFRSRSGTDMMPVPVLVHSHGGGPVSFTTLPSSLDEVSLFPSYGNAGEIVVVGVKTRHLLSRATPYSFSVQFIAPKIKGESFSLPILVQVGEGSENGLLVAAPAQIQLTFDSQTNEATGAQLSLQSNNGSEMGYTVHVPNEASWLSVVSQRGFTTDTVSFHVNAAVVDTSVPTTVTNVLLVADNDTQIEVPVTLLVDQDPPIAVLKAPAISYPAAVTLDATESSSPNGQPLSYAWRQLSGPEPLDLSELTAGHISVPLIESGAYIFSVQAIEENTALVCRGCKNRYAAQRGAASPRGHRPNLRFAG